MSVLESELLLSTFKVESSACLLLALHTPAVQLSHQGRTEYLVYLFEIFQRATERELAWDFQATLR